MPALSILRRCLRQIPGVRRLARSVRAATARLPRPLLAPPGCTPVHLNGDPLWLPDDLLKFVTHTNVARPGEPIQLLAETSHYLWVRDRLRVGDSALDLGANIGLFAAMMARRVKYGQVGWVHALEPSPKVCADLVRVLHANGIDNVCAVPKAVSDRAGWAEFTDIRADNVNREGSHLSAFDAARPSGPDTDRVRVETVTIDGYLALSGLRPALIKIDVEGAEFLALEGGRKFIADEHPLLVIEIHPDASGVFDHARLRRFLDEYGYTYRHRDKTYYCE